MPYYDIYYGTGGEKFEFPFVQLRVTEEELYEAGDDITVTGVKYRFTLRGVLAASTTTAFQTLVYTARCRLMTPRKAFGVSWSEDNISFQSLWTFETNSDINWGPKPISFDVDEFAGGRSGFYTYVIECVGSGCMGASCSSPDTIPTGGGAGNFFSREILALTRSYSYDLSPEGLTRRTVSGRLIVTSQGVAAGRNADYHRPKVTPGLPGGFQRVSAHYSTEPSGRVMVYQVVDQEVQNTYPNPLTSARASFSVHQRGMGGMADYHLAGEFAAPIGVPKATILSHIGALLLNRFPVGQGLIWDQRTLTDCDVFNRNAVAFSFTARAASSINGATGGNWLAGFGTKPPGSTGAGTAAGPFGGAPAITGLDSGIRTDSPTDFSICVAGSDPTATTRQRNRDNSVSQAGVSVPRPGQNAVAGDQFVGLSNDHTAAPYVEYTHTVSWEILTPVATHVPKKQGAEPIHQVTGVPTMTIVEAGVIVRDGKLTDLPEIPQPFYGSGALTKVASISPTNSIPLAVNGTYRHTVSFRYVSVKKGIIEGKDGNGLEWKYPNDPRSNQPGPAFGKTPANLMPPI